MGRNKSLYFLDLQIQFFLQNKINNVTARSNPNKPQHSSSTEPITTNPYASSHPHAAAAADAHVHAQHGHATNAHAISHATSAPILHPRCRIPFIHEASSRRRRSGYSLLGGIISGETRQGTGCDIQDRCAVEADRKGYWERRLPYTEDSGND